MAGLTKMWHNTPHPQDTARHTQQPSADICCDYEVTYICHTLTNLFGKYSHSHLTAEELSSVEWTTCPQPPGEFAFLVHAVCSAHTSSLPHSWSPIIPRKYVTFMMIFKDSGLPHSETTRHSLSLLIPQVMWWFITSHWSLTPISVLPLPTGNVCGS